MTQADLKKLLEKVALLEAKSAVLWEEAKEIKAMLADLVDPDNARAKKAFERAEKKASENAESEVRIRDWMRRGEETKLKGSITRLSKLKAGTEEYQRMLRHIEHLKGQIRHYGG